MSLPLPRNAQAIIDAREGGMAPADAVIVSFIGHTGFENPHVYCDPGVEYDWRFLTKLATQIYVKPGIDARSAMKALFDEADLMQTYPMLVDDERQEVAFIVDNKPLKLWALKRESDIWKGIFG